MKNEMFLLLLMASLATILEASTLDSSKNKVGKQFLINGVARSTNGSLGVYEFLRPDCLKGSIRNSLNLTTLLPSLTANDLTGSCLRGNGKFRL